MHEQPQGGMEQHAMFRETENDRSIKSLVLKEGQKIELKKEAEPWV